jgi:hypothetical protein
VIDLLAPMRRRMRLAISPAAFTFAGAGDEGEPVTIAPVAALSVRGRLVTVGEPGQSGRPGAVTVAFFRPEWATPEDVAADHDYALVEFCRYGLALAGWDHVLPRPGFVAEVRGVDAFPPGVRSWIRVALPVALAACGARRVDLAS